MTDDKLNPKYYKAALVIPNERVAEFLNPESGDLELEYIEVMEFMLTEEEFIGHLKGQAFKYQIRLGHKDPPAQELGKAGWYIDRLKKFFS